MELIAKNRLSTKIKFEPFKYRVKLVYLLLEFLLPMKDICLGCSVSVKKLPLYI